MQLIPLQVLTPGETKEFVLDLVKNTNLNDPQNKKRRGQLVVELTYVPLKSDSLTSNGPDGGYGRTESGISKSSDSGETLDEAGLLSVMVVGAEEVEGEHHNNPYALLCFKGEEKKTKVNFPFDIFQIFSLCEVHNTNLSKLKSRENRFGTFSKYTNLVRLFQL